MEPRLDPVVASSPSYMPVVSSAIKAHLVSACTAMSLRDGWRKVAASNRSILVIETRYVINRLYGINESGREFDVDEIEGRRSSDGPAQLPAQNFPVKKFPQPLGRLRYLQFR